MRNINIVHSCKLRASDTYDLISNFTLFEKLCSSVKSVDVTKVSENVYHSSWHVDFHDGEMVWLEKDTFCENTLTISFEQIEGDAESFIGAWKVIPKGSSSEVHFNAEFSLGIPSLADILEPIAEAAIKDNITEILNSILIEKAG